MLFGYTDEQLDIQRAAFTAKEIAQQPDMWLKTVELLHEQRDALKAFVRQVTDRENFDVIMVGAGTSNYVGISASEVLNSRLPYRIRCYATTDLVVEPEKHLSKDRPTLLVSFARSGNSPESVGAVEVANQICDQIYHLFITCNGQGALTKLAGNSANYCSLVLPPETNDKGFAMTSSFSCMYLASLLVFQLEKLPEIGQSIRSLCSAANRLVEEDWRILDRIVGEYEFDRVVYLGTGVRKGIAQEAALKMLELNAGKVVTFFESPLGFRHGPKSIINDKTLTVFFGSSGYPMLYERDLISELSAQRHKNRLLTVSANGGSMEELADYNYKLPCDAGLGEEYQALLCAMLAQIFALLKSLKNEIGPDNPFPTGEVNRVVKGVTIYPYPAK